MNWHDTLARFLFPDRCHQWRLGPRNTDWRCLLDRRHLERDEDHLYEPDCWYDDGFQYLWGVGKQNAN